MPCARTRACSLHLHCGLNPTLQIKGLRLREREGPTRDGGGEQPQPRLSGSSPSPTFLFIRLCTALQEQGGLVRARPEGPGIQVWGWGSCPGRKGRPEWESLGRGPQCVCPETQGEPGAWRGTWAEVAGMGIQRQENPDGCMCVGEVGGAPGSGPCHAVCPFHGSSLTRRHLVAPSGSGSTTWFLLEFLWFPWPQGQRKKGGRGRPPPGLKSRR